MKKIVLMIMVLVSFSCSAYAYEKANKITDENVITELKKRFKSEDSYYVAQSITANVLSMEREHISDYFHKDFVTYYVNPEGEETEVRIKGIRDFESVDRSFSYNSEAGDETDVIFDVFRTGEFLENENIKIASPLCVLTPKGKFSHACIWVKYNDGSEKIYSQFSEQNGELTFKKFTDEEYMKEAIMPDVESFKPETAIREFTDCDNVHINTLLRLGFISGYEDNSFRPDKTLTRAEGVKLAVDSIRKKDYIESLMDSGYYESVFSDVDKSHWASVYITYAASSLKIINGFQDGLFRPEDTLTKTQFAKMIVCALGFENEAIAEGGYPEGFKKIAEKLGLIIYDEDEPVSRETAAEMIYNALFSELNKVDGYTVAGDAIAQVTSKEIMMEYVHDLRVVEGELKIADKNIVTVGDESFLMGYDDALKFSQNKMLHFIRKNEDGVEVWMAGE